MIRLPAPSTVNGDGLLQELQAAGLPCDDVALSGSVLLLGGLDDSHRDQAVAIAASHTGTLTAEQQDAANARAETRDMEDRARQLVTKARAVLNGTDTFTPDQVQRALAAVVIYLARQR